MKTAIAIRHVHFEDLGAFAGPLEAAGYTVGLRDAGVDELHDLAGGAASPDLLVVLGGPIGACEDDRYPFLGAELRLLETRLQAGLPTLGICLGAQLMARVLGARVHPMGGGIKEIGWAPVALTPAGARSPLRHLGADVPVLHWHGDTFDLPEGADLLASTTVCANQAYARGRHALALQCHPEASGAGFERWLIGHAAEIAAAGVDPCMLRTDAARFGPRAAERGRRLIAEWLDGLSGDAT